MPVLYRGARCLKVKLHGVKTMLRTLHWTKTYRNYRLYTFTAHSRFFMFYLIYLGFSRSYIFMPVGFVIVFVHGIAVCGIEQLAWQVAKRQAGSRLGTAHAS